MLITSSPYYFLQFFFSFEEKKKLHRNHYAKSMSSSPHPNSPSYVLISVTIGENGRWWREEGRRECVGYSSDSIKRHHKPIDSVVLPALSLSLSLIAFIIIIIIAIMVPSSLGLRAPSRLLFSPFSTPLNYFLRAIQATRHSTSSAKYSDLYTLGSRRKHF